ncbi:MAG: hypothetical protein JWN50_152 [Parcubacteria group bacterium]|nr:hypothetical protein [Parcubacteria group bacterium]
MTLEIIFLASGAGLVVLLLTKMRQLSSKKDPLLLRVISLGDARMRDLSHQGAHFYADSKEDLEFFWKKSLPLHAKNTWNKVSQLAREKSQILVNDLRNTKLLKKDGDISEFFKAMSEQEIEIEAAEKDLEDSQKEDNTVE